MERDKEAKKEKALSSKLLEQKTIPYVDLELFKAALTGILANPKTTLAAVGDNIELARIIAVRAKQGLM
jgi:hypothetical protein